MPVTPEQALLRLYAQAAKRLRAQIRQALANDAIGTAAYRHRQLDAINAQLRALDQKTRRLAPSAVVDQYMRGADLAGRTLAHVAPGTQVAAFTFSGTHPGVADVIARNLTSRLSDATDVVGRRTEDAFRRIGLEETGQGVVAGASRREVSAAMHRRLLEEAATDAATGFVDARGARWDLGTYTRMAARTTMREAMTAGTRTRLLEVGHDLVTVSVHGTTCDICAPFEGQTYSLTGDSDEYDELPDGGPPWHPNCEHVIGAGTGDLQADLDALEAALAGGGG